MDIVDFVKEAGRKIGLGEGSRGSAEAETATAERGERLDEGERSNELLRLILEMNQGVEQPRVAFDDGVATVWGKAPNQAVRENTILVIGNVQGVARVDDRMEVAEPGPQATFYTVKKGDTLSAIAKEHYGDAGKYRKIFEANRTMLDDPDRIYPGQVLRIPTEA